MYADSPLPISSSSKPWQNAPGQGACKEAITQEDGGTTSHKMQDGRCQFCISLAVPVANNACMDVASSAIPMKMYATLVSCVVAATIASKRNLSNKMLNH